MSSETSALPDYLPEVSKGLTLMPEQASAMAGRIDTLYIALVVICGLLTVVVFALIAVLGYRYRANSRANRESQSSEHTHRRVELGVLAIMLVIFMGLFGWASSLYLDMFRGPSAAMTINVIGKQWMWKVQHPDGTREINTIHVPVDETINLRVTSQDVIHSFYLPAFRLKRDVLPGSYREVWFTADNPGVYRLFCAEYCGSYHAQMRGKIVVMEQADYQQWLTRQGESEAPAVSGAQLFQSYGCSGCHMGKTGIQAPSLAGVFGRAVPLAGGATMIADEAYLHDSIVQPQKHVVAGFDPIMPSYSGQISEGEILQIIAYIKSLEPLDWKTNPSQNPTQGEAQP
ncbi:cytochrome c oxidase subunit 2 [Modicisalibacter muralis]|uniref:cytochrome-c oxidase n=1 Tax=Modicisalibacter muralis TaxID=119000 RepID=A0A1G9MD40_9GAMM|nr:cytochrome c oxidase subunit II [Halomonas muralis]SDL72176.1 cytochrome c oxidase subunit 2 [Halomonas muralis]